MGREKTCTASYTDRRKRAWNGIEKLKWGESTRIDLSLYMYHALQCSSEEQFNDEKVSRHKSRWALEENADQYQSLLVSNYTTDLLEV
jgi:hypothetical protein